MTLAALFFAVVGLGTVVQADESEEVDPPAAPAVSDESEAVGEEIVVYGELEVVRRRRSLDRRIRATGYRPGVKKEDRTIYRPEAVWKPTVVVYDDGFVVMKRSRVRFEPWVKGRTKAVWLSCIPPLSLMCIRLSGRLVSPARLSAQKGRTMDAMDAPLDAWQEAIASNATRERLDRQIPDELEALWTAGVPMGGVGEPVEGPDARRSAILMFWAGRACTREGAAAREVAALFLEYEVQASPFPLTEQEVAQANRLQRCEDRLAVSFPEAVPQDPAPTGPAIP